MSRSTVMCTPAYDRARRRAEQAVWRAIETPGKLDEELEVQIALDVFAEAVLQIIQQMPLAALAPPAKPMPARWPVSAGGHA